MKKELMDKIKAESKRYVEHDWDNNATPWSDFIAGASYGYELAREEMFASQTIMVADQGGTKIPLWRWVDYTNERIAFIEKVVKIEG